MLFSYDRGGCLSFLQLTETKTTNFICSVFCFVWPVSSTFQVICLLQKNGVSIVFQYIQRIKHAVYIVYASYVTCLSMYLEKLVVFFKSECEIHSWLPDRWLNV